jgi:hypothetical protein
MALLRIDFVKDGNEHFRYSIKKGYFNISRTDTMTTFDCGDWFVEFNDETIHFKCNSVVRGSNNDMVRDFTFTTKEGSLFLYTSPNNWYWYWREKHTQDVMDTFNINKIIPVDVSDYVYIEQINLVKYHYTPNGEYCGYTVGDSELKGSQSFKIWLSEGVSLNKITPKMIVTHPVLGDKTKLLISDVFFGLDSFLLVQNRKEHRTLYINKDLDIQEVAKYMKEHQEVLTNITPVLDEDFVHTMLK